LSSLELPAPFSRGKAAMAETTQPRPAGFLERRPMVANSAASGIISVLAELLRHWLTTGGSEPPDLAKVTRQLTIGSAIVSPLATIWHLLLERLFRSWKAGSLFTVLAKTAAEQAVFAPVINAAFMASQGLLEGRSPDEVVLELKSKFVEVMQGNVSFWVPVGLFQYKFVSPRFRVIFGQLMSVLWVAFLISKTSKAAQQREPAPALPAKVTPDAKVQVAPATPVKSPEQLAPELLKKEVAPESPPPEAEPAPEPQATASEPAAPEAAEEHPEAPAEATAADPAPAADPEPTAPPAPAAEAPVAEESTEETPADTNAVPQHGGEWVVESVDGDWDAFLTEMGMNWFKRQAFRAANYGAGRMRMTVEQSGNVFSITNFAMKTTNMTFHVGGGKQEATALEGSPILIEPSWVEDGQALEFKVCTPDGQDLPSRRQVLMGERLVVDMTTLKGVVARRYYCRA